MLPTAYTSRLRAPTVTVRPIQRTICKKLKISVESFQALSDTLSPILKSLISVYEQFTVISKQDQDLIREMVLDQIWQTKTPIQQQQDAQDYVIGVVVDKVFAFYRETGQLDKLHDITLKIRVSRLVQS